MPVVERVVVASAFQPADLAVAVAALVAGDHAVAVALERGAASESGAPLVALASVADVSEPRVSVDTALPSEPRPSERSQSTVANRLSPLRAEMRFLRGYMHKATVAAPCAYSSVTSTRLKYFEDIRVATRNALALKEPFSATC